MQYLIILFCLFYSHSGFAKSSELQILTKHVNPLIGTGAHGHTFPGAVVPFGMVQLSPDTGTQGWDWSSGYHYSDDSIIGFSHTHLSGIGIGDGGDILLMPFTDETQLNPGTKENPDSGYRSRFSHQNEIAEPGFYSVFLDDYKIKAELTCTERVGFHRYIFPKNTEPKIILDLKHGISDELIEPEIKQINSHTIIGKRISKGWSKEQHVYFAIEFSEDISLIPNPSPTKVEGDKCIIYFTENNTKTILIKVGISAVSADGALANLKAEIPHWDFELTKKQAKEKWNKELNKIQIADQSQKQKEIFYTALYHTMIHPSLYSDFDGKYRGLDNKIHQKKNGRNHYTVFSLWDTFRAVHPLFTITKKEGVNDFVQSLVDGYEQTGILPMWPLWGNETNTMIGYHAAPVIAEAYLKGFKDFDIEKAYQAMKATTNRDELGLKEYKELGFVAADKTNWSVSRTLEYAYDDWCIAQIAKALDKEEDYKYFLQRSQNHKNVFDTTTGFMRGKKANGEWVENFNPLLSDHENSDYIEGNAWQYSWFVPHDVDGLIELMGGKTKFIEKLDQLFENTKQVEGNNKSVDISGLIGQYAHGNEPSHHIAYLYSLAGDQEKTNQRVQQIMQLYNNTPDGLPGNDDCGQLSAWYIFSSLGFYPLNPVSGEFIKTQSIFKDIKISH